MNPLYILYAILIFGLLIFIHELGHFLAGKWRGAYIDRFQIWFGKPIWQKKEIPGFAGNYLIAGLYERAK